MRYLIFLFLFNAFCNLSSQNLIGTVKNMQGDTLPGTLVSIKKANLNLVCNEMGGFQTQLPKGDYNLTIKHIGYDDAVYKISVNENINTKLDITLNKKMLVMPINFSIDLENYTLSIVRNTIDKAPFYNYTIKSNTAELYAKEKIRLSKIPKILAVFIKELKGVPPADLTGKTYMQESVNEIEFTTPNQHVQTIKALSSSVPEKLQLDEVFEYVNGTIYNPAYERFISPLDQNAFEYYDFKHEGMYSQEGQTTHKIQVIPRYKDSKLLSGYIYIENDSWHLLYSDLTAYVFGLKQNFVINYQKINNQLCLPNSYIFKSELDIFGTSATVDLFATIKYKNTILNDSLSIIELSNLNKKRNFQVYYDSLHIIKTDSLALKQNKDYWINFRGRQIDSVELEGFKHKDSIQIQIDSIQKKFQKFKFTPGAAILGGKISNDTTFARFSYNGILYMVPEYNYVDGFWIGERFVIEKSMKKSVYNIKVSPFMYYTTARHRLIGGIDFEMYYSPMKLGKFTLSGGSASADFNFKSTERFDNAVASLFFGWNESNYYQKDYLSAFNTIDIANGLRLGVGLEIANRQGLPNSTKYAILGDGSNIQPNMKDGEQFDKTSYSINLSYTPYAYYSVKKGMKNYEYQTSPTFNFSFKQGIKNEMQKNSSVYNKISVGIEHSIHLGHFSNMNYFFNAGTFLWSVKNTDFTDFYHIRGSNAFSTSKMPFNSYLLLNSYRYSTNRHWVDGRINYTSRYIFLKRLPFLQGKPFNESLHLKGIYTPQLGMYNELGYSLNVSSYLNLGAYTSFDNLKYRRFAVRLSWVLPSINFL